MNNNIYNWHDERMSELKMREIEREIVQLRILKEAGISKEFSLLKILKALDKWLSKMIVRFQSLHSSMHTVHKVQHTRSVH